MTAPTPNIDRLLWLALQPAPAPTHAPALAAELIQREVASAPATTEPIDTAIDAPAEATPTDAD